MKNRNTYNVSQDFLNKINAIQNLNKIKKTELKQLIIIYIKLNSLFNIDDKILNLFLPYILYANILFKDEQSKNLEYNIKDEQSKNLEYNIKDVITSYNEI